MDRIVPSRRGRLAQVPGYVVADLEGHNWPTVLTFGAMQHEDLVAFPVVGSDSLRDSLYILDQHVYRFPAKKLTDVAPCFKAG